jgi:uncharacterized protein YciI
MVSNGKQRRNFLGLGLAAAGAGLVGGDWVAAAEQPAPAGPPMRESVYIVIYRPGARWLAGQPQKAQPLREHGRYMLSLHREGRLHFAGPFGNDGGAAVFTAVDDAEAEAVLAADPGIKEQILAGELRRWSWIDWEKIAARAPGN